MDNKKFKSIEEFTKDATEQIELGIKHGQSSVESHMNDKQQGDADAQFIAFFMKEYKDYAFKASFKAAKKFIERCNEDFYEPEKFIDEIGKAQIEQAAKYKQKNREQQLLDHVTSEKKLDSSLEEFRLSALQAYYEVFFVNSNKKEIEYEVSLLTDDRKELEAEIANDRLLNLKKNEINKNK